MGEIILANNPGTDNELIILEKTVDSQDRKDMADLDIIIASYKKMLSDSLGVSVPRSAGAIHISIINDFSKILNSVENFKKVFDDPIATLAAVKQYQETSADLAAAMKAATLYFSNRGIEYDRSQSGYAFTHALGQ
jgi:hypothetical protein